MIHYHYDIPANEYLMPMPKSIETGEGTLKLHLGSAYCIDDEFKALCPILESQLGLNQGCEDVLLQKSSQAMGEEEYSLKVTTCQVIAKASTLHGMLNAVETLRQLLLAGDGIIPCCRIEDSPLHSWRGFMLDTSRHFFTVHEIEKLIDVGAMHHLNRFHWHLTDDQGWRFPVDGYPLLEEKASKRTLLQYTDGRQYGGFYSKEEIREVVAYAEERMVMVIPEIDVPGHSSALLAAYPSLGCDKSVAHEVRDQWGIFPDTLCLSDDGVYRFLKSAISTLSSLFPSPFIHIGGDECPTKAWETCPSCRKKMEELHLSPSDYQGWFTKKLCEIVRECGKRCIGWDEILTDGLPKDCVIMSWRGKDGGIKAAKEGHDVIMCPRDGGLYLDYKANGDDEENGSELGVSTMAQIASYDPLAGMGKEEENRVLGAQGNLWSEDVHSGREAEYLLYPRLALLAERLWNPVATSTLTDRMEWEYKKLEKADIACYRGRME